MKLGCKLLSSCLVLLLSLAIAPWAWAGQPSLPIAPLLVAQATGRQPSVDSLRQQQQQLEQKRRQLDQQQERLENLQESAETRLDGLQDTIQVTAAQIRDNEQKLKAASDRLATLQAELVRAETLYQQRQFSTVARLRFLQRQQGSQGWAVLLQSNNLNDFLDRRRQLRLVYQADRTILTTLKAQAEDLENRRQTVERQKNEIALLTQKLLAQKAEYQQQAQAQQQLIDRLRADRKALEAAEDRLARDSEEIAALIRRRLAVARNRVIISGTGILAMPADGSITSGFGYRVHPILGYRRFHAGIDFGGGYGSTIRAADSGVVIFAGWYGGYGRSVVIDHGNTLTTLYAHASRIYVSEGQRVKRGQPIAAIGSTGLSTGPHLHFEVRKNGEPINPGHYL